MMAIGPFGSYQSVVTAYEPNAESAVTAGICSTIACETIILSKGSLRCTGTRLKDRKCAK